MTDELDRLRDALRSVKPAAAARVRGVDAAMAAFEGEFAKEARSKEQSVPDSDAGEKISPFPQGSNSERRLTGQIAPKGGARPRRRSMTSRISNFGALVGGTAIAAGLAAFVVVPNIGDKLKDTYSTASSELSANYGSRETDALSKNEQTRSQPKKMQVEADFDDSVVRPQPLSEVTAQSDAAGQASAALTSADEQAAPPPPAAPAMEPAPQASIAQARKRRDGVVGRISGEERAAQPSPDLAARGVIAPAPADVLPNQYRSEGRDRFEAFEANPVKSAEAEPVSTFSVDVDTASYSFLRSALNRGQIPPANAIRLEELINYFPYDYAAPDSANEPFKANVTVTPTPWNADTKLMHIGIKGYTPPAAERPRSNITLLIDTSGSMNAPDKLPLLISSFKLLLNTLDQDDTVSIVTYAGSAGAVLEPTPASDRAAITAAFDRLRAGGSTAGAAGLRLAYEKAQESFDSEGINRVILATDGDFNVGFSSPDEMKAFVEKKRETGVFLSVLGFGQGNYNDHLMQALAQNGNGVAAYIDTLSEARKVLADEAGGALIPIAKDVKIQVEFNPAEISEYRLVGYETRALNREDFNNDKIDAGEIGSGHTVTAIYELTPKGSPAELIDSLRYAEQEAAPTAISDEASDEYAFVKIRYKLPNEDTSTLITRPVGAMDEAESLDAASSDTRFAASVAAFGQKLRGDAQLGVYGYDDIIALANGAKGNDRFGYRAEFVNLARLAGSLARKN